MVLYFLSTNFLYEVPINTSSLYSFVAINQDFFEFFYYIVKSLFGNKEFAKYLSEVFQPFNNKLSFIIISYFIDRLHCILFIVLLHFFHKVKSFFHTILFNIIQLISANFIILQSLYISFLTRAIIIMILIIKKLLLMKYLYTIIRFLVIYSIINKKTLSFY